MQTIPKNFNFTSALVSEKYDGIQARWDGFHLTTRTGNTIHAPSAWLVDNMPAGSATGELWIGRGTFQQLQGIVSRKIPDVGKWGQVKFINFATVKQIRIESEKHLERFYQAVLQAGGEGVVITAPHGTQYKKKPIDDNEGLLIELIPGAGKYAGLVNGFKLELRNGQTFKVSAGMTQDMRVDPPQVGAIVRFKFNGYTVKGLPRHARIDGIRAENTLNF